MHWWIWVLLGLLLLVAEAMTPGGFFVVFFGVGALFVGLLAALGVAGPLWLQLVTFTGASVVLLLLFRSRLVRLMGKKAGVDREVDAIVGEAAVSSDAIAPGGMGKAEFRGSAWSARNVDERAIARGQRCRVDKVEGLTLFIKPE